MSRQVIKRKDGFFAIYSSVVDGFLYTKLSRQALVAFFANEAADDARKRMEEILAALDEGHPEKIYYQFAMTYEAAKRLSKELHKPIR